MSGHGWVNPLPGGARARCGGPALCSTCAREKAAAPATAPAEILHLAAGQIRRLRGGDLDGKFWHALADWLEHCARDAESAPVNADGSLVTAYCDEPGSIQSALRIARAYLLGAEVPA